ncbi:MAG: ABC transporter ATP-binding protein, partial [Clostridia bacterium]|nr:ABC transporter ATP-binding protein [Clostridia bacterium]
MKQTLSKIFKYMGNAPLVIFALLLAALAAIMTIVTPDKVGEITDIISDGLVGGIDMSAIARVGITLIIFYLIGALANFVQHYIMATVTLKASRRMRHDLSVKTNKVPQKQFGETS